MLLKLRSSGTEVLNMRVVYRGRVPREERHEEGCVAEPREEGDHWGCSLSASAIVCTNAISTRQFLLQSWNDG